MRSRRRGELLRFFTFGDRVPAAVGFVLALMLAASVWGWMERDLLAFAALSPPMIFGGQLWRLVAWPLFQDHPFTLLFGGLMIYFIGQQLAYVWSERRFLLRFFGYAAFASVATTLLALVWPPASSVFHIGIWPVANALLVSWAMLFPERQVNIWGILPLTGRTLALLVVGGTVLYALAGGIRGFAAFSPHLFALLGAWVASGRRLRSPWRDARQWWYGREQKRRIKHLKVVKRDGSDDRPRWMN